jgi:hypothetical protein
MVISWRIENLMPKLFLHVGLPKTGSTFLQNSFEWFEKKSQFKQLCYPFLHAHESFLAIHSGNGVGIGQYLHPGITPKFLEPALQEKVDLLLAEVKDENRSILISSEFFATAPADRITVFKNYLQQLGFDVEIIVVVRPLGELLFSAYMQCVKRHGLDAVFVEWVGNTAKYLPDSYIRSIMAYDLPVHVLPYDKEHLLGRVLRVIGEEQSLAAKVIKATVNRSLTRGELELLMRTNIAFKDEQLATKISDKLIREFPDRRSATITESEVSAYRRAAKEVSPPFHSYQHPVEKEMAKYFALESTRGSKVLSDSQCDELIDGESLSIALGVVSEHWNFLPGLGADEEGSVASAGKLGGKLRELCKPCVDDLRNLAVDLEQHDIRMALDIMRFAHFGRPGGQVINSKIEHYKRQLTVVGEVVVITPDIIQLFKPHVEVLQKLAHSLEEVKSEQASVLALYAAIGRTQVCSPVGYTIRRYLSYFSRLRPQ